MDERDTGMRNLPAELIVFEGQEELHQYLLFHKVLIGAGEVEVVSPRRILLPFPFLEKEQCEIERLDDDSWVYRNLSEDTFTFVGGRLLKTGQECALHDGDMIRLSNDRMLTAVFLESQRGNYQWDSINMDTDEHVIQVTDATDIGKDERDTDYLILSYKESAWEITSIHSNNVAINGVPITEPGPIRIDDKIQVDDTLFIFEGSRLIYGYPVRMQGGLAVHIDNRIVREGLRKKALLKDIDLSVPMGSMVLILGGSGAGKSTFINAVTGYEKANATITEGGYDYYRQYNQVKYRIGMVPQADLMRSEDTVYGTMINAAEMRLSRDLDQSERVKRVMQVLQTFGLEELKNEQVGKLSGGQRKRLSISVEFISLPTLFILDEPDSGLDGIMARELMENLKLLAVQGRIVMVISHAPDRIIDLFDKVIVLAKAENDQGGRTGQLAYYGDPEQAKRFFRVRSMEDIVRRINSQDEGGEGRANEFIQRFKEMREAEGLTAGQEQDQNQNQKRSEATPGAKEKTEKRFIRRGG